MKTHVGRGDELYSRWIEQKCKTKYLTINSWIRNNRFKKKKRIPQSTCFRYDISNEEIQNAIVLNNKEANKYK